MSHHTVDWIDSRLTAEIAPSCTLWVVVGSESALYTAVNGQGEILATVHRDYLEVVDAPFWRIGPHAQRMLESSLVWHLPFGQRQGFLFHPNVTLVPRRLFRHGDLSGYFRLLLEPDNYIYTSEELPFWDAYLVAATDGAHARFFQNLFPGARIRHSAAALLIGARTLATHQEHTLLANIRNRLVQIVVLERDSPLFYNTFPFSNASDLLYYVLLAYHQFRLNPQEVTLWLSGSIMPGSELHRKLYAYIRDIRFAEAKGPWRFPREAANTALPAHCYFELMNLPTR
ncbi:MAG: DUF3822 family protein [Saprospiraceae bacterium]|nr:DUF3822 family protein [Saprospiraceae bacterium]MDW8483297.1 DUF3822 family protein [Saprospiraceae bacterium]